MQITGVTRDQFELIVKTVSELKYDGNVRLHQDAHDITGRSMRGRIDVHSSRGPGARTSSSGRRGPYACWHAYRDVLAALFTEYPEATVRTAMATYRGAEGFLNTYPRTAYRNIGSMMQPAYMPSLCNC